MGLVFQSKFHILLILTGDNYFLLLICVPILVHFPIFSGHPEVIHRVQSDERFHQLLVKVNVYFILLFVCWYCCFVFVFLLMSSLLFCFSDVGDF